MKTVLIIIAVIIIVLFLRIFIFTPAVEKKARNNIFRAFNLKNMKRADHQYPNPMMVRWENDDTEVLFWWDKFQRPLATMNAPPSYTEPLHIEITYPDGGKETYKVRDARFPKSMSIKESDGSDDDE